MYRLRTCPAPKTAVCGPLPTINDGFVVSHANLTQPNIRVRPADKLSKRRTKVPYALDLFGNLFVGATTGDAVDSESVPGSVVVVPPSEVADDWLGEAKLMTSISGAIALSFALPIALLGEYASELKNV